MLDSARQIFAGWFQEGVTQINEGPPENDYNLKHVGKDPVYFDLRPKDRARQGNGASPELARALSRAMVLLIPSSDIRRIQWVTGVPNGGNPFAEMLASLLDLPLFLLDKREDDTIGGFVSARPANGSHGLVVENVSTTAESTVQTIDFLDAEECWVTSTLSAVDRDSGAEEALAARGHILRPYLRLTDLLVFYMETKDRLAQPCERSILHAAQIKKERIAQLITQRPPR
jgi:orotate phosphoribosyltransferase